AGPRGGLDGRDPVVAAGAGDFLDEVDVIGDVRAPAGHGHGQPTLGDDLDGGPDALEQSGHLGDRVVDADQGSHAVDGQFDDGRLGSLPDLRGCGTERSSAEFDEQISTPACGHGPEIRVDAAFEATRGLRGQPVATRGPGDGDRVEVGSLDDDLGGGLADFDVGASHDAGQADDLPALSA